MDLQRRQRSIRAKKLYSYNKKKQPLQIAVKGIQARRTYRSKRSAKVGESRKLRNGIKHHAGKQRIKQSQQLEDDLILVICYPISLQETICKDRNRVDESDLTEINRCEQLLSEHSSSNEDIQQSAQWRAAVEQAKVPFLYHQVLECDCRGLEYTIENHDITLRVPEGAIPKGKQAHIEIGVTAYGPFIFPKNTQPISPIVWLCILEKDIQLQKPFWLILPYFLMQLTKESIRDHQIEFVKATDHNITDNHQLQYKFQRCDTEPLFASSGDRSYGVLESMHCCFHCLKAKMTQKIARDAGYCLTRIECSRPSHDPSLQIYEIHFAVTYFLKACIEALEQQFDGYHISRCDRFKFNKPVRTAEISITTVLPHNDQMLEVGFEPSTAKIRRADIDFWKSSFEEMELMHKRKTYPPRVKMTVITKAPCQPLKLLVKVTGCSSTNQLDMDIIFPLGTSVSSGLELMLENHSQTIHTENLDAKPSLQRAFSELLSIASQWKTIGTLLGIKPDTLETVKHDEQGDRDCLRKMLTEWCKLVNPSPTWRNLINAVKKIDEEKASQIRRHIAD